MAAVICNCIGDLCKTICCLPCRACEFICTAPCKVCSTLCCSPLAGYVAVTAASNIPVLVFGAKGLVEWGACSDNKNPYIWLLGMVIMSAIHILAALYLTIRIQNKNDTAMAELTTGFERASYLLCHDILMALYILVLIVFFVWMILGGVWYGALLSSSNACLETMEAYGICLGFGWFYFGAGPCSLCLSMCCTACCDDRDYSNGQSLPTTSTVANNNSTNEPSAPAEVPPSPKNSEDPPKVYDPQGIVVTDEPGGADVPVAYAEAVPATAPVEDAKTAATANPFFSEGLQSSVNQFMSQFTSSSGKK